MPFPFIAHLLLVVAMQTGEEVDCLACHRDGQVQSSSGRSLDVDGERFAQSVHGSFGCAGCHPAAAEIPHPEGMPAPDCSTCHAEPSEAVAESAHRNLGTAACRSCHGSAHEVVSSTQPGSPVAKGNLADRCGACHANPDFLRQHGISFARPVEAYRRSVHGRALAAGNQAAPSCSSCHGNHAIFAANDSRSSINHWNVPERCGACHPAILESYRQSVHGQAVLRGTSGAPVCTDCHGEHAILAPSDPQSPVNPMHVSSVTCSRCHADERLAQNLNLPLDRVPSFEASYHGLALRAGSQTVANCASCHGVHNILPSSDPRSTVHPANLAATCGQCHPGAGEQFGIGPVHVLPGSVTEHVAVRWIRGIYLVLIPLIIGVMLLHNAVDFVSKFRRPSSRSATDQTVPRMNLHFRVAHWLAVVSFPALVATGFALKFPEAWWAAPLVRWEGQFPFRGTAHRIAGIVLLGSLVYHAIHLAVSPRDRAMLRELLPRLQDAKDFWNMIRYNLGLASRPRWGKFGYSEKAEYWAFVWGILLMGLTGFLLWFSTFTLRNFPKWVADAATAVHYYEAILASLAVLVWHFYMVIFDPDIYPMDRTWLTGRSSVEHLSKSRPGYVAALLREERESRKPVEVDPGPPPESPSEQGRGDE